MGGGGMAMEDNHQVQGRLRGGVVEVPCCSHDPSNELM